jgi:hypothetical protein
MADQILFSVHEASRALSILPTRLKRMAKRKEVPHVVLPDGEIRFRASDLQDWVSRHTIPKREEPEPENGA